jgi:hypothetical protein
MDNGRIMKELKELQEATKNVYIIPVFNNLIPIFRLKASLFKQN